MHQIVHIQEYADIAAIVKQKQTSTTLTAFFELNANEPDTLKTLYHDIPKGVYILEQALKKEDE